MERDTRDIARGASANALGVIARTLLVAFYVMLARFYGAELTGLFLLSRASIEMLSKLGLLGMDRAILARGAMNHAAQDEAALYRAVAQALTFGLLASVTMSCLLQGLATPISRFVEQPELVTPLKIMAWSIPFLLVSAVFLFATRSLRVMRYEIYTKSVLEPFVLLVLGILFYFIGLGIEGLAAAFVTVTALGAFASLYFFSRVFSIKKLRTSFFYWQDSGHLLRIAVPTGIYDFLNQLLQRVDIFLVGHFMSASTVGVFGLAQEAAFTLKSVRQSFDPILIPVISAAHQLKNKAASHLQYQNVTRWILILNGAIFGVLLLAGGAVMHALGHEFTEGTSTLVLLALAVTINAVLGVSELFLLIERPMLNVVNTLCAAGISIGLNLWLIPRLGIEGAALAMVITYALMNAARLLQVHRFYGLQPFTRYHGRALAALSLSLGSMSLLKWVLAFEGITLELLVSSAFLLLYGGLLLMLGVAPEENRVLRKFVLWYRRVTANEKTISDNP